MGLSCVHVRVFGLGLAVKNVGGVWGRVQKVVS
jgi:hypothetical protein